MPTPPTPTTTIVTLPAVLTVKQLADALNQPVTAVIGNLMNFGVLATINEDIDFDTAAIVADEFGVTVHREATRSTATAPEATEAIATNLQTRPPVVTIMGHVDHGKTTLLDTIRTANVAAKEVGGITQHISSYQIEVTPKGKKGEKRTVTFLDTPGHSAFEAMRRHGAQITDLVVLVVAADDGVKPQTVEAINHARVMNVPIVVAINKIDKPEADQERVKRELAEHNLMTEEWGGKTVTVPISAKQGTGIPELLELILLSTDLKDLKANPDVPAVGVVIEAHQEVGIGSVATLLIQNGTLRVGDYVALGEVSGRVRTLTDYRGKKVQEATPSMPVEISGLSGVPRFGEQLVVFPNERDAREAARQFLRSTTAKRATISLSGGTPTAQKEGNKSILNVVVKADTDGSLEALKSGLLGLKNEDVEVRVVADGVGDLTESDVSMASTTKAVVLGFQVRIPAPVKTLADREKVSISLYSIIYELFEAVREVLAQLMPMETVEQETGKVKLLARFRDNKKNPVVGGQVSEGLATPGTTVRIMRGSEVVAEGKSVAVHQGREAVKQVKTGSECGIELEISKGAEGIAVGDTLVFIKTESLRKPLNV